jgi:hypothetical protein
MPTQMTQLCEPGKTLVPVIWHNYAWQPRVVVRRGYLRRIALSRIQPFTVLGTKRSVTRHSARATLSVSRVAIHVSASAPAPRLPALSPWPRRTFIFSRLPCYPPDQLAKLTSL